MQEVELKFFNIHIPTIIARLHDIGAKKEYESNLESTYFENDKLGITSSPTDGATLRVRRYNHKTLVTFKRREAQSKNAKIHDEHEFEVTDAAAAIHFFISMGFHIAYSVRSHRVHYAYGNCAIEIDTYEGKDPYIELEAQSVETLHDLCHTLGLNPEKGNAKSIYHIYPELFQIP